MIQLPKFIPPFLVPLIDDLNNFKGADEFMCEFVKRTGRFVKAEYAITAYSTGSDPDIVSAGLDKNGDPYEIPEVIDLWLNSGLHEQVMHDLASRNSSVSYSSYSWPYVSSDKITLSSGKEFNFPSAYQLLIPFASAHIYRLDIDTEFYGYSAYFFPDFVEFSDQVIQTLITLPEVTSQVMHNYFRQRW